MIVTIIIRAYNEEKHIGQLLRGIDQQQLPENTSLEVIVVDSGSTDATAAIARKMGAIVISISKESFSFGRALNLGCAHATGSLLLFASAHVYPVFTDWIEKMIAPFQDQQVALVYGKQVGNEVTKYSEHQVFKKWFPGNSNYNQLTPFCNNANCCIKKTLWEVQPFDENLTGLEDLDWAKRVMNKGYKVVYEASAPIVHVHEETFQKIKNRYQREAIALKHILPKVHFTFWDFLRLFIGNSLSDFIHATQDRKLLKHWKEIVIFRYMQFYGTYLGHRQRGEITKELKNRFYYPNGIGLPNKKDTLDFEQTKSRKIEYT